MANTSPLTLANLPAGIKKRFTSESENVFFINVYPEQNIWKNKLLLYRFTDEVTTLTNKVTGFPLIFVDLMDIMSHDRKIILFFGMFAAFIVLLLDFRSIKYALIGVVPAYSTPRDFPSLSLSGGGQTWQSLGGSTI